MRHSKYLPKYTLAAYGVEDIFFSEADNTWVIKRHRMKPDKDGNFKISYIKLVEAKQPRTYAPVETRFIVTLSSLNLPVMCTSFSRVFYAWFIDSVPEDHCVMFKDPNLPLKDLYSVDNLYLQSNEEVDKTKIRGNQYYSPKWNIVAKKYEGKKC